LPRASPVRMILPDEVETSLPLRRISDGRIGS
jgi:hypothetical protein